MNPKTWFRSTAMRSMVSPSRARRAREQARKRREARGEAPVVHYFHQVDDPYSHLAVQRIWRVEQEIADRAG